MSRQSLFFTGRGVLGAGQNGAVQKGAKNGAICSVLQFDIQFSHSVFHSCVFVYLLVNRLADCGHLKV